MQANYIDMTNSQLKSIYNKVCDAPTGDGFHIEYMPEFFDTDTMDNSMPHVHTFYEIIWFWEDGGVHTVDFQDYQIEANTLFFLSPGQVHHFDGITRHKGVIIKFCTDFLKEERADEDIFIKYNIFNTFDSSPFCKIASDKVRAIMLDMLHRMKHEQHHNEDFGHLEMLRSMLKMFLIYVHRHGERSDQNQLNTIKSSHRLFVAFRRILEQEYRQLHTVKDYAERLNVSTKTLTNSISECSGKAALSFINDRVLLESKRLLRFTDLMVKEISDRLGYEDPSYFVKFFKRQTGMLPTEFREGSFINQTTITKQNITMKQIAVPTRDGKVDDHFGHCAYYTIFSINEDNKIIKTKRLDSPEGCGCKSQIAEQMQQMGITLMLAGNMGQGAFNKLSLHGIEVIRGCKGNIEDVVRNYLDGKILDSAETCSHHNCSGEEELPYVFKINI